jgi:hypothetical protein
MVLAADQTALVVVIAVVADLIVTFAVLGLILRRRLRPASTGETEIERPVETQDDSLFHKATEDDLIGGSGS